MDDVAAQLVFNEDVAVEHGLAAEDDVFLLESAFQHDISDAECLSDMYIKHRWKDTDPRALNAVAKATAFLERYVELKATVEGKTTACMPTQVEIHYRTVDAPMTVFLRSGKRYGMELVLPLDVFHPLGVSCVANDREEKHSLSPGDAIAVPGSVHWRSTGPGKFIVIRCTLQPRPSRICVLGYDCSIL